MDDLDVADSFLILQDGSFEDEPANELGAGVMDETGPSCPPSSRCVSCEDPNWAFDSDDDSLFSAVMSQERASPPLPQGLGPATRDPAPGRDYLLTQAEHDGGQEEEEDDYGEDETYDQSFLDDGGLNDAISTQQHSHYLMSLLSQGSPPGNARSIPRQPADVYSQETSSDDSYELGSFVVADTDSEEGNEEPGRRGHRKVLNRHEFLNSSSSDDDDDDNRNKSAGNQLA